jgi:TonB family protein
MPPKALIFSPDASVRATMAHVFNDLELLPEPCGDIFSALEALTARDFEVIVADWSEGAEAAFLLKTAGELKARMPFSIVLTGAQDESPADADLVISKPLVANSIKKTLLMRDAFLERMQGWLTVPEDEDVEYKAEAETAASLREKRILSESSPRQSWLRDAVLQQDATSLADDSSSIIADTYKHAAREIRASTRAKNTKTRDLCILGAAAIVAICFAVYHFREPLMRNRLALALTSSDAMNQAVEEAVVDDTNYMMGNDPNITVTPIYHRRFHAHLQRANFSEDAPDDVNENEMVMTPKPSPSIPTASDPNVPASLYSPMPLRAIPSIAAAGAPPTAVGLVQPGSIQARPVQPVNLSDDSAEMLLIKKVAARYPEEAVKSGIEGPVIFQASIARDGTVQELKLIRGPLALVEAAYNAAKQWRFKPYTPNGVATEARITMTVDFQRTQLAMSK